MDRKMFALIRVFYVSFKADKEILQVNIFSILYTVYNLSKFCLTVSQVNVDFYNRLKSSTYKL